VKKDKAKNTMITYKIVADRNGKLKTAGITACNFWNGFIRPKTDIVIRLGTFTEDSDTIAQAWEPYTKAGVVYGRIEFNTEYLSTFSKNKVAGTIVHEIGHTLGMGWKKWLALFDNDSGRFKPKAVKACADLSEMEVELDGGPGTELSHWDEDVYKTELMTGYKDNAEHVLPVTVAVMGLLGHTVKKELKAKAGLGKLLTAQAAVTFSSARKSEARKIDRDHFVETEVRETIPHGVTRRARPGRGDQR
jgi:hypothetical protein